MSLGKRELRYEEQARQRAKDKIFGVNFSLGRHSEILRKLREGEDYGGHQGEGLRHIIYILDELTTAVGYIYAALRVREKYDEIWDRVKEEQEEQLKKDEAERLEAKTKREARKKYHEQHPEKLVVKEVVK